MLVDRVHRTRLLAGSILLWGLAMMASAMSGSFMWLLFSRLGLGMVTGVAGPSVASLIGDYVASGQRGQAYGSLLSGELVGTGVGLVGAGLIAGLLSWRWSFGLLAPPALVVAWLVWRLPEPTRGRQLQQRAAQHDPTAGRAVERAKISPRPQTVLRRDPARLSIWAAVRYVRGGFCSIRPEADDAGVTRRAPCGSDRDRVPQLLDRPRDHPVRLAVGLGAGTFYGLLWAAGSNDLIAKQTHWLVAAVTWAFRVALIVVPPLVAAIAFVLAGRSSAPVPPACWT